MAKKTGQNQSGSKSSRNLILCIGTYFFLWLSGIIVYLFSNNKEDKYLKFHALQAILLGIVITIIDWLTFIPGVFLLAIILWLYGLYAGYKVYEGEDIEMPIIGKFAKEHS